MNNLSIERLKDFESDPLNNFLSRSEMMEVVKELIAIREKGEQVPVGEVVAWNHPNEERKVDFRFLRFDVQPGTQLFTAPQKPVVLPGISELIDACDSTPAVRDVHVWDLAISEVKRLNPSLFSDKSAASGIVKDGE